jgi:hypothetical protein
METNELLLAVQVLALAEQRRNFDVARANAGQPYKVGKSAEYVDAVLSDMNEIRERLSRTGQGHGSASPQQP